MANNPYCSIAQLNAYLDVRVLNPLASDGNTTNVAVYQQQVLDDCASQMESRLGGVYMIPIIDPTTNLPPNVCRMYVAINALVLLLGRKLSEFKAIAVKYRELEIWIGNVTTFKAVIPNVSRVATSNPALVNSDNMTGGPSDTWFPGYQTPAFTTRPSGTNSPSFAGNGGYANQGVGTNGGIGS